MIKFKGTSIKEMMGMTMEDYVERIFYNDILLQGLLQDHCSNIPEFYKSVLGMTCKNCFKELVFTDIVSCKVTGCVCYEMHPTHEVGRLGSGDYQRSIPGWLREICEVLNRIDQDEQWIEGTKRKLEKLKTTDAN